MQPQTDPPGTGSSIFWYRKLYFQTPEVVFLDTGSQLHLKTGRCSFPKKTQNRQFLKQVRLKIIPFLAAICEFDSFAKECKAKLCRVGRKPTPEQIESSQAYWSLCYSVCVSSNKISSYILEIVLYFMANSAQTTNYSPWRLNYLSNIEL